MKPPRTVLMTADTIGGVWTYALELTHALAPSGIQVKLATMGEPLSAAQRAEAAALENLAVFESTFRLEWMSEPWADVERAGEWLLKLEDELRPDIIHLNGYVHGSLPWSAPVLMVAHSCVLSWWQAVKGEPAPAEWDQYRRRVQRGLEGASMVVAPTRAMLAALREQYRGPAVAARVIPNGREAGLFNAAAKEDFILAAGRLGDEAKNISTLGLAAAGLPWPVRVAGRREDASGRHGLTGHVEHLGFLTPAELGAWLGRAAIYALPARYEPFGLSILEAGLSGCALVLGDIASLREVWSEAAVFVPPNDAGALREALRGLIEDARRRAELGVAARARAMRFTPERSAEAYRLAYEQLLRPA